jgi:hypothetical protein
MIWPIASTLPPMSSKLARPLLRDDRGLAELDLIREWRHNARSVLCRDTPRSAQDKNTEVLKFILQQRHLKKR